MMNQKIRQILSWTTVIIVVVVIVSGMASVLEILTRTEPASQPLNIAPAGMNLCPGEVASFVVEPPAPDLEWAATGGTISTEGLYTAGDLPGDYEVQVAGPGGARGRALVHIALCTPTPTPAPTPTATLIPTPTPTPTPIPSADAQGDVAAYATGARVAQVPPGLDIQNASVGPDLKVTLGGAEELPEEIVEWAQEGEVILWMALYEPLPEAPLVSADWLFVLDVDGDPSTGRPPGTRPINADLGDEAAVGLYYTLEGGAYTPFFSVWDPAQEAFVNGPTAVRYWLSQDRKLIVLAIPLATLQQEVERVAGVTLVADAVRGRAAAIAFTVPEAIADLYPDRPTP